MKEWFRKNVLESFFVFVHMVFALYFYCYKFNSSMCDLSGHFSSAKFFSQGYFHSYNDNHFLGFVHDLFYPPLQDLVITIISIFTRHDFVRAGHVYVVLLYFFYLVSIGYLSKVIKNSSIQVVFLFFASIWLYLEKGFAVGMGLSVYDLFVIGLSGQFLGTIFFFVLLKKVLENKKEYLTFSALIALSFLGHVFVGLFSIAVVLGYAFLRKEYFLYLLLGIGLCALSWMPFSVYSEHVVDYLIYDTQPLKLKFFLALTTIMAIVIRKKFPVLLIGAFLIFALNLFGSMLDIKGHTLPKFHYYRLVVYAYAFLLIEICMYFDMKFLDLKNKKINYFKSIFYGIAIAFSAYILFGPPKFLNLKLYSNFILKTSTNFVDNVKYLRTYTVPNNAPENQTFAQYLQSLPGNNFHSSQGIYWGASKSDFIAASYNSILFKEFGGMIDNYWVQMTSCPVQSCMFDQYLRDYNIGTFILDPSLQSNGLPLFQKMCLKKIITDLKTQKNNLTYNGSMDLIYPEHKKQIIMNIYNVSRNYQSVFENNTPIEVIYKNTRLNYYDDHKQFYFTTYFDTVNSYCQFKIKNESAEFIDIFLPNKFKNQAISFNNSVENMSMDKIKFEKVKMNHFKILVDTAVPVWFKIKMSWLPGLKLKNQKGEELPLVRGIAYSLGFGNGEMHLVYEKPIVFYLSYVVSTICLSVFILLCAYRKYLATRK